MRETQSSLVSGQIRNRASNEYSMQSCTQYGLTSLFSLVHGQRRKRVMWHDRVVVEAANHRNGRLFNGV